MTTDAGSSRGPLHSCRVVEIAGLGPGPFAAMLLADLGADVVRVERPESAHFTLRVDRDLLQRSRSSIVLDLKHEAGAAAVLRLVGSADALIEGFRPGVAERLGIGPEECMRRNPKLVYGRATGWGQDGPLANAAGHDIDYIALSGVLHTIGRAGGPPVPPLNLLGDFAGGGMLLVIGIIAALLERQASGLGQVIDAAMVDGAALLATAIYGAFANGQWTDERGTNAADSGSHFYETYETADGKHVAIAAVEPQFHADLLRRLGLDPASIPAPMARTEWPRAKAVLADIFRTKTRADWCELLEGTDACFAPVLSLEEAPRHPHNVARRTFVEVDGVVQPAPAPRFSRTPLGDPRPPTSPGCDADATLASWGFSPEEVNALRAAGAMP